MTPQREEAGRLLRLAMRDQAAFSMLCVAPEVNVAVALLHAQQSAEKALKSVLCLHHLEYRRTHDLEEAARLFAAGVALPVSEINSSAAPWVADFYHGERLAQIMRIRPKSRNGRRGWSRRCGIINPLPFFPSDLGDFVG